MRTRPYSCRYCGARFIKPERFEAHSVKCPAAPKVCPACCKGERECPACQGTGGDNSLPPDGCYAAGTCDECHGAGEIECETCEGKGIVQ